MKLVKEIAKLLFWFALWLTIPAVAVYSVALWIAKHTSVSPDALAQGYIWTIGLLFLPTGFLVDFIYRRFFLERHKKLLDVTEK